MTARGRFGWRRAPAALGALLAFACGSAPAAGPAAPAASAPAEGRPAEPASRAGTAPRGGTPPAAEPAPAPPPGSCPDRSWGGYAGDAECAALAARVLAGADSVCSRDADCVLVHPSASCREQVAAAAHVALYRALPAACTHPAGGACVPAQPACVDGCCATR